MPGCRLWKPSDPYTPTAGISGIVLVPVPVPAQATPPAQRRITWLWIEALVVVFLSGLALSDIIAMPTTTASTANHSARSTAVSSTGATATSSTTGTSSQCPS